MRYLGHAQERQSDANATGETPDNCLYQSAGDILRFTVVTLAACLAATNSAVGQWIGKQTGCYAGSILANPNRPTVANPADITQYGVLELEYGWDRVWPQTDVHQTSLGGVLKFGLLCDLELRWNSTAFFSQTHVTG